MKLVWDADGERLFETGINQGFYTRRTFPVYIRWV